MADNAMFDESTSLPLYHPSVGAVVKTAPLPAVLVPLRGRPVCTCHTTTSVVSCRSFLQRFACLRACPFVTRL